MRNVGGALSRLLLMVRSRRAISARVGLSSAEDEAEPHQGPFVLCEDLGQRGDLGRQASAAASASEVAPGRAKEIRNHGCVLGGS
jgi:hypothetical protein